MILALILVFIVGYVVIVFEHQLKTNKAAPALITGVLCWLLYFISSSSTVGAEKELLEYMGEISSILFFLMGAMTIVEVIDSYHGFDILTSAIRTTSKPKLLILISFFTFFLSAILDNLTTAIVMISLCQKLLRDKNDRLWFAGMVIIAANAGGAWSPMGDVTTTMLWIGGQITATNIVLKTFVPSVVVCVLPLVILIFKFKGQRIVHYTKNEHSHPKENIFILIVGICMLLFVPIFKTLTHMPPFMGMLLALGIVWFVSNMARAKKEPGERHKFTVTHALQRIDSSSILFFLGILLAVTALQASGVLISLAEFTNTHLKNEFLIGTFLGLLSAIVDNVPLVAAAQGMYSLDMYPTDHAFWEFLALSTGTGGSAIIIGSAAGVAVMGIEKVEFFWYIKNISWLALLGFSGGLGVFIVQHWMIG
jgi:Na+/H+ antiporter NhaD/arsenite permease-like protein